MKRRMDKDVRGKEKSGKWLAGQQIMAAMNGLDEELVEIRPAVKSCGDGALKRTAARRVKWAVAAVCSVCLISGSVVFAASRLSWHIGDSIDPHNPDADYYWVDFKPDQVSADAFGEQVRAVEAGFKEEAKKEAENGTPYPDDIPRGWVKEFATEKEALDYIGFDGLRETALPDWNAWHITALGVYGNQEGNLTKVGISSHYRTGDGEKIEVSTEAEIFTENWCYESMGIGKPFWQDEQDVEGKEYVTGNGKTGLIIVPEYDGGFNYWMEGYMIEGEIVYTINLNYNSKGDLEERGLAEDALTKVMHEWMEQF